MATQMIETPHELLHFQLRTAVTMEDDSLAALGELANAARSSEVKKMFRHHADETKQQIANLEKVFRLLELKKTSAPSPSTKGISKQAASLIGRTTPQLRDQAVLASALGNEHYEMSVYQSLLVPIGAMGARDAEKLLKANLDQEVHTSKELEHMLKTIAG